MRDWSRSAEAICAGQCPIRHFALIKKAAAKLRPSAVLSNSGILLGLAKLAANETLAGAKRQRRS
jgi:hypothetical protein